MALSDVIKARRKALGLTLLEIANRVGVAEATVQRWESGAIKNIRYERIIKLAEVLETTPSALMGWEESETPPPIPSKDDELLSLFSKLPKELQDSVIEQIKAALKLQGLL